MRWLRSTAWLSIVAVAGIAIAFLSAALQRAGLAPLLLSSLLIGTIFGATACLSAWLLSIGNRRMLIIGVVLGALLLVFTQHFALYRAYREGWEQKLTEEPELSLFRTLPADFRAYLRQESADGRAWLWLLDAAVVTATAVGTAAWWRSRTPFCGACGRWLQLRWQGPAGAVDAPPAATNACATLPDGVSNVQTRFLVCPQGCGKFVVKLTWEKVGATHHKSIP